MNENLLRREVQDYLVNNRKADDGRIALSKSPFEGVSSRELAEQIASARRLEKKAPSFLTKRGIIYPPQLSAEQCSSEPTASYKASLVPKGDTAADLTGGFGVDTLAFARKFRQVDYFETNPDLAETAAHNFGVMEAGNIAVHNRDGAESVLAGEKRYDLIYADPARRDNAKRKVWSIGDCTPDMTFYAEKLLERCERLIIKLSPMLDIEEALSVLPGVSDVYVVGVSGEVKEILFVLSRTRLENIRIHASDIIPGKIKHTSCMWGEKAPVSFSPPGRYLYDPFPAVRKAGLSDILATECGLKKLAPNTLFYTSDELIEGYQGRIFQVTDPDPDKKKLKKLGKANVVTRNYPISSDRLRDQLKLKDGGDDFILAFGLPERKNRLILAGKVIFD